MRCINLPEHNLTLTAPHEWDAEKHGPCETVTALREPDGFTVTLELEPEEIDALLSGASRIQLKIFGQSFPPVSLGLVPK